MKKIWNWLLIENNRKVLSFLGTGIVVIIAGLWTFFTYYDRADTQPKDKEEVDLSAPSSTPINISATWREIYPNPGSISHTIQDGNAFRYTVKGVIQGFRFQSSGSGTIKGKYIESSYQTTIPSTGHCSGTISSDGIQMKSICVDTVNGKFESVWVRQ